MKIILGVSLLAIIFASCGSAEKASVRNEDAALGGTASGAEMDAGHKLFINNCIQCHNIKTDKIGPKLEGAIARWDNDTARMYAFIKNSQEAIKKGDARAVKVYDEFNHTIMTPMPHLTDGDINQILEYINKGEE